MKAAANDPKCNELKSILYVEDDLHVRDTARLVLEVIGRFTVHACASGSEALLAAAQVEPDLILLDVGIAGAGDVDLLTQLRRMPHLASTPVLFLTGLTSNADICRYMEAGAIGIIAKPLAPLRLTDQVKSLWERRGWPAR